MGQKARLTIEGEIRDDHFGGQREGFFVKDLFLGSPDWLKANGGEIQIIEPEYDLNAFYEDAEGCVYQRTILKGKNIDPWFCCSPGWAWSRQYCRWDIPVRPLRKLVPEK